MRAAPGWNKPGDPVNGYWKQELLSYLGKTYGLSILVETGTCEASTVMAVYKDFKEIHSIELSDYYFAKSKERLSQAAANGTPVNNAVLYHGNSAKMLREILESIPSVPTLFWLDAHSSGGMTADAGDPLPDELKTIFELRPDALVVVDDVNSFSDTFENLRRNNVPTEGWEFIPRFGELIIHRGGYQLPEFNGINVDRALAISDYQCQERTDEVTWLASCARTRKVIVEVGSWKGCTARAMADNTAGTVYAVDTFAGSVGEEAHQRLSEQPDNWLYEEFTRNTLDLTNLRVLRIPSVEGAKYFQTLGLKADLVFLDASHDYPSVKEDILAWKPLLAPGGVLCGHDRAWEGVRQAIDELVPGHQVAAGAIWVAS